MNSMSTQGANTDNSSQILSAEQNGQAAVKARELSEQYGRDPNFFTGGMQIGIEESMLNEIIQRTAVNNIAPFTDVTIKAMDESLNLLWSYGSSALKNKIITATALFLNWTGVENWSPKNLNKQLEA